ncbi:MAG: hypothetical protein IAG13_38355 [Deltaproteobacteria bacterium]|nr:hypothetical protein [Nannocystaceae bacterium]
MSPTDDRDGHPLGSWISVMSIGASTVVGYVVGGWLLAIALFVLVSAVVFMRALRRSPAMLREPEVPGLSELPPAQAIAVLSALRGPQLQSALLTRIEQIERSAEHDARRALAALDEVLVDHPRSVPALLLRARLQFELEQDDAAASWSRALALALDGGLNLLAARAFDRHVAHRERLVLDDAHLAGLAKALAAHGHHDHAAWCRARVAR